MTSAGANASITWPSTGCTSASNCKSTNTTTYAFNGWYKESGATNKIATNSATPVLQASTSYTDANGKWTSTSASGVAQAILESGGNFVSIDEAEFQFNAVSGNLEIKGYADAANGLVPTKSTTGISWTSLPPDLSTEVANLKTELSASTTALQSIQAELSAVDGKISTAIANANHLTYEVVSDLSAVTAENVIYLYNDGNGSTNNNYKEYLLTNGNLEEIGSTAIDLSQYATVTCVTALETTVGTLSTAVNAIDTRLTATESALNALTTSVNAL
jgi:hypothetical protein